MSHQCLADAFAPWEAYYKNEVFKATWGHLAPKKNKSYTGHIVWALDLYDSGYLNPKVLSCELEGLSDSPWFYEAMIDFLQDIHEKMFSSARKTFWGPSHREEMTAGTVWRWDGTFHNYEFRGKVQQLNVPGLTKAGLTIKRASTTLTKKDFEKLATEIRGLPAAKRKDRVTQLLPELRDSNPKFNEIRFKAACGI